MNTDRMLKIKELEKDSNVKKFSNGITIISNPKVPVIILRYLFDELKKLRTNPNVIKYCELIAVINNEQIKKILVNISNLKDGGFGCWEYYHYCVFPDSHKDWRYTVKASQEGFGAMASMWRKAGYEVIYENEYPN